MKKSLLFTIIVFIGITASAQIVHEKISDYDFYKTMIPKYGPNGKFFVYPEFSFSMYTPPIAGDQFAIKYLKSFKTSTGADFKLRFTNWLSAGTDLNLNFIRYKTQIFYFNTIIAPQDTTFPSNTYIKIYQIGASPYIRLNYGRRGNTIGKYIDFSLSVNYTFLAKFVKKYKENGIKQQYSLVYNPTNKLTYELNTRLGFRWWAIIISYRLNNYYTYYAPMPKLSVGVQFAFSK